MRILVDGVPKGIGGIGTLIINLVNYNEQIGNRKNIIFEFLVPLHSEYISILESKGYKYYEVPKVLTRKYREVVDNVFANNRYDYVWINNTSKVNIYLPWRAKKSNTLVIVHSHGVQAEEIGLKKIAFNLIELFQKDFYCKLIDIPFACSQASANFFYPEELLKKCVVISNGIETEKFAFNEKDRIKIRSELGIKDNDVVIGAVGRLTAVKNYIFLEKLLTDLPEQYKVIILGDGEDEEYLKAGIEKNGIGDRFFLLGRKQNIPSYLSAMDIFAMPSLNEGMPFALIEAQANGLKCIVSTGIPEEAKVIDCVSFISLDDKQSWIDEIMSDVPSRSKRGESYNRVADAGYSIGTSYRKFCSAIVKTNRNGVNKLYEDLYRKTQYM